MLNSSTDNTLLRAHAIFTVQQGRCRIIFGTKKSQDPCRHNSAKIIERCQYVYEKSVGPGDAMTADHSLIQLGSGGAGSPPTGTGQVSGGGEAPGSSEDLVLYTTKMVKNSKIICIFEFLGKLSHPTRSDCRNTWKDEFPYWSKLKIILGE